MANWRALPQDDTSHNSVSLYESHREAVQTYVRRFALLRQAALTEQAGAMATPGPQGTGYVEVTAHVWVNKSTGQVQFACVDQELSFITALRKTSKADKKTRELLAKYRKPFK